MFYSPSTNSFYAPAVHGQNMPDDVLPISAEEHEALFSGQAQHKVIVPGADGRPHLVEAYKPVATAAQNKAEAVNRLIATDWINHQDVIAPESGPRLKNRDEYLTYRAWLRGVAVNPADCDLAWPAAPQASWEV